MRVLLEWLGVNRLLVVAKWRLVMCLLPILLVGGLVLNAANASRLQGDVALLQQGEDSGKTQGKAHANVPPPYYGIVDLKNGVRYTQSESLFHSSATQAELEKFDEARHCLAQAIYFEARSEPVEGWEAVGQVVINRAYDKRYPTRICDVVFQGKYRRHRCQFSFACDGLSDQAYNREFWRQAHKVAGRLLTEGSYSDLASTATHYHADYVAPHWSSAMQPIVKIGRHIFYREGLARDHPYPHHRPGNDS